MSYTPNTWTTGDTITATKLNNIEQGIANAGGGGALIVTSYFDDDEGTYVLDKTAQEIYDAFMGGTLVLIKVQYGTVEDYVGWTFMCPIIWVSNYNYTNDIRFYAAKGDVNGIAVSGKYSTGKPSITIYQANGLNDYPKYYLSTTVTDATMTEGQVGG